MTGTAPEAAASLGGPPAAQRLMDAASLARTVARLAHEVGERHPGLERVVVAGVREGGVPVALALAQALAGICGRRPPLLALDVAAYRDDRPRPVQRPAGSLEVLRDGEGCAAEDGHLDVTSRVVVLVDDVLHTGRTLRAALDLLADHGRPAAVEPLVLVDRGQRELPLRATYVGRNLPVAAGSWVDVVVDPPARRGAWLVTRR